MPLSFSYWKQYIADSPKLVLLSNLLFVISLLLPAYTVGVRLEGARVFYGFEPLLLGWLGPFAGEFTWYANLCYFMALKSRNTTNAMQWAVGGLGIALSFLLASQTFLNEGVGNAPLQSYEAGYYLWLASMSLLAARRVRVWYYEIKGREGSPIKYVFNLLITRYRFGTCMVLILLAAEVFVYFHNPSNFLNNLNR